MAKNLFLLLGVLCCVACYSTAARKAEAPAAPLPAAAAAEETATVSAPEPIAAVPQPEPVQVAAAEKNQKAVVTAKTADTAIPTQKQIDKEQTHQTAAIPPAAVQTEPAPDQPVFNNEKLIETKGRMLHPYAALTADEKALQTAPWAYEQLKYGIYYGFIKAGTAYIRNRGLVSINGRPAYLLQTTAFSASVIDAVFKVRDINQSWLDAAELYSHGYGQSVREGNYRRDEWLNFDYAHRQYSGLVQKKEEPRAITGPLEIPVLDMLSSLYYVRAQELSVGKDVIFDIVNREKQYPLIVKVLKKETVKTAAGKFNCIVVEPQIRGEGIFVAKGKSLKVWLTDDAYKMPVKMSVEVFIGSVSAELLEYKRQAPAN